MNIQTNCSEIRTFGELPFYRGAHPSLSDICNCGPGLADDREGFTDEDSFMYLISGTDEEEFDDFIRSFRIPCFFMNTNEAGKYYTYKIGGILYYIYFLYADETVRIIRDCSSTVAAEELSIPGEGEKIGIYQYSLNYEEPMVEYAEPGRIDCGMLYIFRFPDGSLALVDSGHGSQATEDSHAGLYRFMKEISGTPDGEKIKIRTWFFTHAHGDHCGLAATFLGELYRDSQKDDIHKNYADLVQVESVIFNFPSYHVAAGSYAPVETMAMRAAMRKQFPNANYVKLHTGQSFSMFGVNFEVLYTWEDSVKPDGEWGLKEFNSTSTVLKVTYGSNSFLMLADTAKASEAILMRNYTEKTLHADIVQVAHHCINNLDIYGPIGAGYALVPSSYRLMSERNAVQYSRFKDICTKGIYCADVYTWEMVLEKDGITVKQYPRYDRI